MFIYFDPPYYEKGRRLYMNYFSSEDHEKLRNAVSLLDCKWIMTYDDNEKIDFVPYHSLTDNLNNTGLEWLMCTASQVDNLVGNNEYLFYCEPGNDWIDPAGRVHILKEPISQFFRKIIAEDQGNVEKYNYKTNPDITLTLTTTTEGAQSLLIFSENRNIFIRFRAYRKALFFVYCGTIFAQFSFHLHP